MYSRKPDRSIFIIIREEAANIVLPIAAVNVHVTVDVKLLMSVLTPYSHALWVSEEHYVCAAFALGPAAAQVFLRPLSSPIFLSFPFSPWPFHFRPLHLISDPFHLGSLPRRHGERDGQEPYRNIARHTLFWDRRRRRCGAVVLLLRSFLWL